MSFHTTGAELAIG